MLPRCGGETDMASRIFHWCAFVASLGLGMILLSSRALAQSAPRADSEGWRPLFNGKDLSGWTFHNPKAKKVWVVCDEVRLDPADPARLIPEGRGGTPDAVLLSGDDGRGSD